MVFFATLYSREASVFGEFSVFLVVSTIISGLITGFFDAEILKGRRLTTRSVTRRVNLSLLFFCLAFLLIYCASSLFWQNFSLAVSVAFSLSILELVTAALIHQQKFALLTYSRLISSFLLILIILCIPVADPYAAYACAVLFSAIFSALIFFAAQKHQISLARAEKSENIFERLKIGERAMSALLRSVGSSPVLFATLVLGKEFAAAMLLAQKLLSFPIGSILNVMVLPVMTGSNRTRVQFVRSILPQSIFILTASLVGISPILYFADSVQMYTAGAFVLVGIRLYCERMIYSSFLILQETRLWILTLFILDAFVLLSLAMLNMLAYVPEPFYVLGAVFVPTLILSLLLAGKYRRDFAKKV